MFDTKTAVPFTSDYLLEACAQFHATGMSLTGQGRCLNFFGDGTFGQTRQLLQKNAFAFVGTHFDAKHGIWSTTPVIGTWVVTGNEKSHTAIRKGLESLDNNLQAKHGIGLRDVVKGWLYDGDPVAIMLLTEFLGFRENCVFNTRSVALEVTSNAVCQSRCQH